MACYKYGYDITTDLTGGDVDITTKRTGGDSDYNFYPTGILINPSADDLVEIKTVVGVLLGNQRPVTLRLECGKVHKIGLEKILKSGTTTNTITIFGDPV